VKVRTALQLQELLDRDFAWRLKELNYAKDQVRSAPEARRQAAIRGGVPMLYAHWEGFVRVSAEALVRHVELQGRTYRSLKACFVVHGMSAELGQFTESKKHSKRLVSVKFIMAKLDEIAKFSSKSPISTKSNLSSEVSGEILSAVGIPSGAYAVRSNFMDESLLRRRNSIAHGEWLDLDEPAFMDLADGVITLIRWFKTDIENLAATKGYLVGTP